MSTASARDDAFARLLFGAGAVFCAWAFLLAATGGFELSFLTAHNPVRPLIAGCACLPAYVVLARGAVAHPAGHISSRTAAPIVFILAGIGAVVTYLCSAKVAGGSDSWGYLSEAELWLSGHLGFDHTFARDVPWPDALRTFT